MFGLKKEIKIVAPMTGKVVKIENVKDDMFSQKMLGDGIAIECSDGKVYAPIAGEISAIVPSQHAFGIKAKDGFEVLVHIGLDTVYLKGEGFSLKKEIGDVVEVGDLILEVDTDAMAQKGIELISPIVATNPSFKIAIKEDISFATANETVIFTYKK